MYNKEIDVAQIMREIKAKVVPEKNILFEVDHDDLNEENREIISIINELDRIHSFIENTCDNSSEYLEVGMRIPEYSKFPFVMRKIFILITRTMRKLTRFLAKDQTIVNKNVDATIKALVESQEQLGKSFKITNNLLIENTSIKQKMDEQISLIEKLNNENRNFGKNIAAGARVIIDTKWKLIDKLYEENVHCKYLKCRICGHHDLVENFEVLETKCRFNGGKLIRYKCPECGVVFGPMKFMGMNANEISDDYTVHYVGYSEGDSTEKEVRAFELLNPKKEGVYLNYGCGHWSNSMEILHEKGYTVYGFDPYAINTDNEHLITDKKELQKIKFDGIFSNDLLEHILDPVSEMIFMKSILKNEHSLIAHSTSCYSYKYEYTRFHAHFYLGDSLKILSEKSGLVIQSFVDELEAKDFACAIFCPENMSKNDESVIIKNENIDIRLEALDKLEVFQDESCIPIKITNHSKYNLNSMGDYPIMLSYHILDNDGKILVFDNMRTSIIPPLSKGESKGFNLNIDRQYVDMYHGKKLRVTLVQENNVWLDELGVFVEVSVE